MAEKAHSALDREPGHEDGIGTGASSANGLAPSVVLRQPHWVTVGRLTPGLIHEINNILCVVSNHVQLLLLNNETCPELSRRNGEVDLAKPLQVINEYTDRAQVILHRFADYARPLEEHSLSRFRVSDLLEDALALAHLQRPLRKLHLHRAEAEGTCEIEGDPNRMIDIFIELLMVAAHAIPCGGTLTISTHSIPSTELRTGFSNSTSLITGSSADLVSGEVVIGFTGVGQWPQVSDRGLELARILVEQLGGKLVCESAEGIWVALPQRASLSPSPAAPSLNEHQNGEGAECLRHHP